MIDLSNINSLAAMQDAVAKMTAMLDSAPAHLRRKSDEDQGGESVTRPKAGKRRDPAPGGDLIPESAVIEMLGVSEQWLKDHRTRVEPIIPHVKLGRRILYPRRLVNEWMATLVESRPRWERAKAKVAGRR